MSRKNSISLDLFDSSDASVVNDMSADCLSREVEVRNMDKASIHCSWTAGPVGTLQIEAKTHDDEAWFNINAGVAWAISGSDSEAQIVLTELPFTRIRLKFARTSGTGTLEAFMNSKTVGL